MLKGIDLPKEGELLTVNIDGNGYIFALTVTNEDKVVDHEVDVIQIPKGHGRLIDETEVKKNSIDDGYDLYVSWTEIDNAPTILEAGDNL